MRAIVMIQKARAAGVELALAHGALKARGPLDEDLRDSLREHRGVIIEVLAGDRCRACGEHLPWPAPVGVVFADGTAECMPCADRKAWRVLAAAERAVASPDALADDAELTIRGEALP
jgi:hypothetical protein